MYWIVFILLIILLFKICDCYGSYKFFKNAAKGPYFENNRIDY